jgi:hypothetical protein
MASAAAQSGSSMTPSIEMSAVTRDALAVGARA